MADQSSFDIGYFETDDLAKITNPAVGKALAFLTGAAGGGLWRYTSSGWKAIADGIDGIEAVFDGGGAVLTTGVKLDLEVPFACTIIQSTLLADQSGSIVVDIYKDTYANYPPTGADSITASAQPTISSATKSQDSTLTGWTTFIAAGSTLRYEIISVTTIMRAVLSLKVLRTG
jgi:hypothetical protein